MKDTNASLTGLHGRRIILLSLPIEALLELVMGRVTIKLPPEIPTDLEFVYSFIEPEHQVIKIAVSHPSFDFKEYGEYIKLVRVTVEPVKPSENETTHPGYTGDSLLVDENWSRLV